jgi:hypothetical protein
MRTIDGLSVRRTVGNIRGGLGREDMGLNISDGEGPHVIREIWLKIGRKR